MKKIGRNEPCPCGSGKKYKSCHLGREDKLYLIETKKMKEEVAEKITSLPEVTYGRSREMADDINIKELTCDTQFTGIKFIDFISYVALESFDKGNLGDKHHKCAGLIVNPKKTEDKDSNNIYIAITPNIHDSSLIHELAHVLDFLGGSGLLPGSTFQMGLETGIPIDHLDHTREFGNWLDGLKDRFNVELDAEDKIISYLNEHKLLLETSLIKSRDDSKLIAHSKKMMAFLIDHKVEIDELIKDRIGYQGKHTSPK